MAIGYKKGKTRDTIQDTDLLILDTWDSKIEQIVPEYASGGRYLLDASKASYGYDYGYQVYHCK